MCLVCGAENGSGLHARLYELEGGELLLADGSVAVEGRGKYLKMRLGDIAPEMADEEEWFADPRPRPETAEL
jgi:hypothetical protein